MIDMYVSYRFITTLVYINYRVKEFIYTLACTRYGRNHRYTHHITQELVIELSTTLLQLIIHIKCHNHAVVHVDKFGGKV